MTLLSLCVQLRSGILPLINVETERYVNLEAEQWNYSMCHHTEYELLLVFY